MWLFVGLGNPGAKFQNNRHNIGFMAAEHIARRHNFSDFKKSKFKGDVAEGKLGTEKVILLKPTTFMNLSGEAVLPAASFYKIPPENIVVFYDEIDLEPTKLRVKQGGGHNGHNGLRNIDQHLGKDYHRVRLGVGRPEAGKAEVHNYVLGNFAKSDDKWLNTILESLADEAPLLVENNADKFMSNIAMEVQKL